MNLIDVQSFIGGSWIAPDSGARTIENAYNGQVIAQAGRQSLDSDALLGYASDVGGPALRAMTFHERARMLKALALHLTEYKSALFDLSFYTGATRADAAIDIEGGIGTMFVYASKGRRNMPDSSTYVDGEAESLSRGGQFIGHHVCTPLQGVAVHINAFNFPVWGMLEKLAPSLLAGMPVIVKPATSTCYLAEQAAQILLNSGLLPAGALQLVTGDLGDTLNQLGGQDVVSFTGSADTALKLRSNPNLLRHSTRFIAEQDSLNASILGPDAHSGTPEFDLFINEVNGEISTKAGQKCTAIRRILVPEESLDSAISALTSTLSSITIGDPRSESTQMGALVSRQQKRNVQAAAGLIAEDSELIFGDPETLPAECADGAFLPPMLYHCANPDTAAQVHDTEAFGPVATVMTYRDVDHALSIINRAHGSLVVSIFTHNSQVARDVVARSGSYHGRVYFNNRDSMHESTGHGSPLPHLVHGGPGRAGGGEELGGLRGVMNYMQRTAIQGSPDIVSAIVESWIPGSAENVSSSHPFTRGFNELQIGDCIHTGSRTVSLQDIEQFANFTGDRFYAHMDEQAAKRNPFFPGRVAHGYLLLSFAAGLFVEPDEGPVLANTGLDNLRFLKPVEPGDSIKVRLTVMHKEPRTDDFGEVRWHTTLTNQRDETVAEYELLTMNALK
jgi:oxepin-CoA hydrolase/3-oxo-5,6-dehydrosuberyl-CoA semialdehyde dehydrogenase